MSAGLCFRVDESNQHRNALALALAYMRLKSYLCCIIQQTLIARHMTKEKKFQSVVNFALDTTWARVNAASTTTKSNRIYQFVPRVSFAIIARSDNFQSFTLTFHFNRLIDAFTFVNFNRKSINMKVHLWMNCCIWCQTTCARRRKPYGQ